MSLDTGLVSGRVKTQLAPANGSRRTSPLPPNWIQLREQVLSRDGYQCTWSEHGIRCTSRATDVEHIGDNREHGIDNLRALCGTHHDRRSASQAGRMSPTKFKSNKRPDRGHPGRIARENMQRVQDDPAPF